MRCAKCGSDNPDSKRFCGDCGTALARAPTAQAQSDNSNSSASGFSVQAALLPEGERKTVTALFADLKGSTELMADLDPEEARAIIDPALRIMIDAVRRYEGYVVQSTGDGIFALFGAPVAHEDHPQRALLAALLMQQQLLEHGRRRSATGAAALEARVGINTGEVVVRSVETGGRVEYTPIGHTANLASRLQTVAAAGSIAVSEETRKLVEGYFELRPLGPIAMRGITEPTTVYEVAGLGSLRSHFELSTRRGLTRFVGREFELQRMRHALELAIGGHGQIVAVMADAGTGKSRLFYEFNAAIPPACKVLRAYSVSHGKASAWLPVLELLRAYFGIQDVVDAASRRAKIAAVLDALDPELQDTLPYLFGLLGVVEGPDPIAQMDPQIKRGRTLDAIKRIILRETLNQPLVVVFEDLHWIDNQTQVLLDLLADNVADARVLLLTNYRPEYSNQWSGRSYYTQLRLNPLIGENAEAMLTSLLGDSVELRPLKRLIADRTGGNPFFIEEMVQTLLDQGALVRNGAVKVARPLSQLRLPPTVQGILAARIDRLPSDQKDLLQVMAVIGRESPLSLIRHIVSATDASLAGMLAELRAAEFIFDRPGAASTEHVFKHALTQEVAYSSLLIERRKLLHESAGQALEAVFAAQMEDHLSQLAHHYSLSDNLDKAVEYLGRAGQQAMQRSAHADAVASLSAAIELLQKLPDTADRAQRELPLQLALGPAFIVLKGWVAPETERAFSRALEICESMGDPPDLYFALYGLYTMYHVRGDYSAARERANQLLQRAQLANDPTLLVAAHSAVGQTSLHTGELLLAMKHLELVLSLYDEERDSKLVVQTGSDIKQGAFSHEGWTLWLLGYPDQAVEKGNQAMVAAQENSYPNKVAGAEFFATIVRVYRREPRLVQEMAERVTALSFQHGLGAWLLFSPNHRGWAIAQQGRYEEGIELMQQAQAIAHAAGADIGRTDTLCELVDAYTRVGRLDDALSTVTVALAAVEAQEERYYEAEIYRLKGELLLLKQSDANAVEAYECFERAIEIAQRQKAKSLELRATTSLARLLATQGRRDEARTILADIYNWFTEGFDTADLIDAKALLDELSN
jgi:predicted ATPase/class 3 adenylate cyclase